MAKYRCALCDKEATRLELMDFVGKEMKYVPLCKEHESNIADENQRDSMPLPSDGNEDNKGQAIN